MSKVADMLKAAVTNKRTASDFVDFSVINNKEPSIYFPKQDYEVVFTAVLGTRMYVAEELTYDNEYLNIILKHIKRSVVQEIFGEFREPINKIRVDLYHKKYDEAMKGLNDLEESMFSV
jgi:hypothetical protein